MIRGVGVKIMEILMTKSKLNVFISSLVLLWTFFLIVNPVLAVGNIPIPNVLPADPYIFVGESEINLQALIGPNDVYVGKWQGGVDVQTTKADKVIYIPAAKTGAYFVDPALYTDEGDYYICEPDGYSKPAGGKVLAFHVEKPYISIVPVDDVCPDVNRTGQIFLGTNLEFIIVTNLYHIQNRIPFDPNNNANNIFDINVTGSNGKDYKYLIDTNNGMPSLKMQYLNANKNYWPQQSYVPPHKDWWNTAAIDPDTGLLHTPAGKYQISVSCWANHLLDYTTGASSDPISVSLVDETINVSVNPGNILRTQTATATVIGKPKTEYIIGIIECPLKMTGEVCDRPPWFKEDPDNPAINPYNFDTFNPHPIGNTVVYPSCCNGLTFWDVVPHVDPLHEKNPLIPEKMRFYTKLITDCNGTAKIDIDVDNTVWKADNNPVYTIHVQKVIPNKGIYLNDQTELTVQKGDMTIQISQASDVTNTPVTEAYLGDVLKIAGINTDSTATYLYMTGPCQPECGGGLIPIPYPHGPIGPGPETPDFYQPRIEGFDWIFTNGGLFWETGYLPINPGNYTIYAFSNWPPHCPACLDCGGETCKLDTAKCKGCDGNVCTFTNCPNCDVYAVATIQLKAPELTALSEDIERCCCPGYPCGTTIDNHPIEVSGVSTGNPMKTLNLWMFGKGKIGDKKYINQKLNVNCDGTYTYKLSDNFTLCQLDAGTYDLIIQDPGYNHQFDVILEDDLDPKYWASPVEVNKKWILSGYPDIGPYKKLDVTTSQSSNPNQDFLTDIDVNVEYVADPALPYDDDWRKLVQVEGPGYKLGTEVLYALIRGLDDPSVDDNYVHVQFTIKDKSCLVGTDFEADRTYGNKPLTVRFTDKSYQATSWSWDFGDGTTSTEQNPVHTYTNEGRYTVSLITNGDAKAKAVKNDYIRVAKGPTAKFTYTPDSGIKAGESEIQFTDLSSGNPTSWIWQFGDGASSPLQSPVYTYPRPGVYTIRLTVSDENGISSESATQEITVEGEPVGQVTAKFETKVQGGTKVSFIDQSSGSPTSWSWDFGDGSVSSEQFPVYTYLKEGTYNVTLSVSNEIYSDTISKVIGIR